MEVIEVEDVDYPIIDNDELPFSILLNREHLFWLIDAPDQLERDLVLEVHSKVSQEENAFLDDFHVGLQHELIFEGGINIIQKLSFLIIFQGNLFRLRLLFLYIVLHFIAQLSC